VSHAHDHSHAPRAADLHDARRRVLWATLVANALFMVVEIVGGLLLGSLALVADGAHMGSDVVGLGIALVAQALATRPADARHTYGLQRAEVLGAQANAVILLGTSVAIMVEAVRRIGSEGHIEGGGMLVIALVGLAVNLGSAVLLRNAQGENLNMRAAFVHMASDAAASIGAIAAAIAIIAADARWVDPAVSIAISVLVAWSAWTLLRDTSRVLLEGTPRGIDVGDVERALLAEDGVVAVHHLHVWDLASETPAMSVHVVLDGEPSLHDAQRRGDRLKEMLGARFGIAHATLELECHDCETEAAATHVHQV
jgi:cobalt-zinc-cadmium efflux system protein